jgi:hypothetical protein
MKQGINFRKVVYYASQYSFPVTSCLTGTYTILSPDLTYQYTHKVKKVITNEYTVIMTQISLLLKMIFLLPIINSNSLFYPIFTHYIQSHNSIIIIFIHSFVYLFNQNYYLILITIVMVQITLMLSHLSNIDL